MLIFKTTCAPYYKLELATYLTTPGLAWDAMLLHTRIEPQLINEVDMLSMTNAEQKQAVCVMLARRDMWRQTHNIFQIMINAYLQFRAVFGRK